MVGFFQTLERVDPSKKTNWLADHPAPPDRIARIQKEAQLLHVSETPTENVAELRQVQSRLGGVGAARPGQAITQTAAGSSGRTRSTSSGRATPVNVPDPSGPFASYTNRNGVYRISYPSYWQVYELIPMGWTVAP